MVRLLAKMFADRCILKRIVELANHIYLHVLENAPPPVEYRLGISAARNWAKILLISHALDEVSLTWTFESRNVKSNYLQMRKWCWLTLNWVILVANVVLRHYRFLFFYLTTFFQSSVQSIERTFPCATVNRKRCDLVEWWGNFISMRISRVLLCLSSSNIKCEFQALKTALIKRDLLKQRYVNIKYWIIKSHVLLFSNNMNVIKLMG